MLIALDFSAVLASWPLLVRADLSPELENPGYYGFRVDEA